MAKSKYVSVVWNGAAIQKALMMQITLRAHEIGQQLVRLIKANISRPNPYPHKNSSKSGEFPKMRSGELYKSITYRVDSSAVKNVVLEIGVLASSPADAYALYLEELGIRDGTTRPFLRRTCLEHSYLWFKDFDLK